MLDNYSKAVEYIRNISGDEYTTAIILGTGLGGLVKHINVSHTLEYSDIPGFPVSTVESHHGRLILGTINNKKCAVMQGRFHYYEGYTHQKVTYPIHLFRQIGVKNIIVSNACGALNPSFRKTDLMIMTSHINLHFSTPYFNYYGKIPNYIYSKKLTSLAVQTAENEEIPIQLGAYASVHGPNLETPAEYRFLRKIGADVVGMSTVPEALIASSLGIDVLGLSIITDEGFPDSLKPAMMKDIIDAANEAEPKMTKLTLKLLEKINE